MSIVKPIHLIVSRIVSEIGSPAVQKLVGFLSPTVSLILSILWGAMNLHFATKDTDACIV